MRKRRLGVIVSVATLMLAFAGSAVANVTPPVVVAKSVVAAAPQMFVDSKGTVNVVWTTVLKNDYYTLRYARRPKGATHFTQVTLPHIVAGPHYPLLYQVSPGVLQILVEGQDLDT